MERIKQFRPDCTDRSNIQDAWGKYIPNALIPPVTALLPVPEQKQSHHAAF
jgi:hypothetical protein